MVRNHTQFRKTPGNGTVVRRSHVKRSNSDASNKRRTGDVVS